MASNIVNLGDLVPGLEGKNFILPKGVDEKGNPVTEKYHVPGDLDSEVVFEFLSLFEDMTKFAGERERIQKEAEAAGDDPEAAEASVREVLKSMKDLNDVIKSKLLAVFQIANPELKSLPFGAATTVAVLGEILAMMGLADPVDEPVPPTNRAARRSTGKKTTTRSTKPVA